LLADAVGETLVVGHLSADPVAPPLHGASTAQALSRAASWPRQSAGWRRAVLRGRRAARLIPCPAGNLLRVDSTLASSRRREQVRATNPLARFWRSRGRGIPSRSWTTGRRRHGPAGNRGEGHMSSLELEIQ